MLRTVFALFESYEDARGCVDDLLAAGIGEKHINVLVDAAAGESYLRLIRGMKPSREPDSKSPELGGRSLYGLDSLLAGERPVNVPDAGRLIAGGDMATIVVKAAPGVESSLQTSLRELRLGQAAVESYLTGLRHGSILLWARVPSHQSGTVGSAFERWHGTRMVGV